MKYLLLVLIVLAVLWFARGARPRSAPRPQARPAPPEPATMLACAQCGLHLPRDEALPGRGGVFCSEAHRAAYEKSHPSP